MPLSHSGWSAWISVDDKELHQYSVKVEEHPGSSPDLPKFYTISAWIPSQIGKEFSIHIEYDEKVERQTDCAVYIDLDGRRIRRGAYFYKTIKASSILTGEMETDRIERPFVFSALRLTDRDTDDNVNLEQIGTIKIQLNRQKLVSDRMNKFETVPFSADPLSVHETAKKVASHCVSLGPAKPQFHSPLRTVDSCGLDVGFFLTYIFYYTSSDILRAREIMSNDDFIQARPDPAELVTKEDLSQSYLLGGSLNPIVIDDTDDEDSTNEDENDQSSLAEKHLQISIEALQNQLDFLRKRRKSASKGTELTKKKLKMEDVKPPAFKAH